MPQITLWDRTSDDTFVLLTTLLDPLTRVLLLASLLLEQGFSYPHACMLYAPCCPPTQHQMVSPRLAQVIPVGRARAMYLVRKDGEQIAGTLGFCDGQGHPLLETRAWQIPQLPFWFFWFLHTVFLSLLLSKIYPCFKVQFMSHLLCEIFSDSSSLALFLSWISVFPTARMSCEDIILKHQLHIMRSEPHCAKERLQLK